MQQCACAAHLRLSCTFCIAATSAVEIRFLAQQLQQQCRKARPVGEARSGYAAVMQPHGYYQLRHSNCTTNTTACQQCAAASCCCYLHHILFLKCVPGTKHDATLPAQLT
jgi:hypothetical protein